MAIRIPEIGHWFIDRNLKQLFEVVAIDEQDRTIEIQYVDGEVSEVDIDLWGQMSVQTAAPPEDWTLSLEMSGDPEALGDPIAMLEADLFEGSEELY